MRHAFEIIVAIYGVIIVALGGITLVRPASMEGFITSFANSRKAHFVEMFWRLSLGVSLVLLSNHMWHPTLFLVLGWMIIVSSTLLLILPWRFHRSIGTRVIPMLVRFLRLYAVGVIGFGLLLLYGVLHSYVA